MLKDNKALHQYTIPYISSDMLPLDFYDDYMEIAGDVNASLLLCELDGDLYDYFKTSCWHIYGNVLVQRFWDS